MYRGTPQLVLAHHSAKFSCCGLYFMFGLSSRALASRLVECLLRVCKNFSVPRGEILYGLDMHVLLLVELPVNTCNVVCEINRWHRVFHTFRQHQLIGVAN